METGDLNPAFLPTGARVGRWRVVAPLGRGAYGAVYRAAGVEPDAAGSVALKLALHPRDERFAREAELLSRIRHPAVPRLLDAGDWLAPSGTPHPYLAMQLVEGVPLYDWARQHSPSSRQVLRLLATLARALAATHASGGVHRDVKGGNVLVRSSDARPFLIDFGAGHYVGASTLTWQLVPPGTPAYRSPEAGRFMFRALPASTPPYAAGPADDVFALGVTAYRLITGEYPPSTDPTHAEFRLWDLKEGPGPRPPCALNSRCCLELSDLVSWMLAVRPEARGSARELAEALEGAARGTGQEADIPLFAGDAPRYVRPRASPPRVAPQPPVQSRRPWLKAASLGGALALGIWWALRARPEKEPSAEPVTMQEDTRDAGTVAVGDSALTAPVAPVRAPSTWTTIALEVPPKPLPGQRRPDANGRCPGKAQVPINGGCWIKTSLDPKDCNGEDTYVYKDGCYSPAFLPPRPATSSPADLPDSGP